VDSPTAFRKDSAVLLSSSVLSSVSALQDFGIASVMLSDHHGYTSNVCRRNSTPDTSSSNKITHSVPELSSAMLPRWDGFGRIECSDSTHLSYQNQTLSGDTASIGDGSVGA
jgi:hypothetical protein